jgi:hypothetical protein
MVPDPFPARGATTQSRTAPDGGLRRAGGSRGLFVCLPAGQLDDGCHHRRLGPDPGTGLGARPLGWSQRLSKGSGLAALRLAGDRVAWRRWQRKSGKTSADQDQPRMCIQFCF